MSLSIVIFMAVVSFVESQTTNFSSMTEAELDQRRQATAKLSLHLQNLEVSRQKVPPPSVDLQTGRLVVPVNVYVTVASVLAVNDAEETMTTVMQIVVDWKDRSLAWNASEFGDVETLEMPLDAIWIPNIVLVNSLEFSNIVLEIHDLFVRSDGTVLGSLSMVKETTCKLDLSSYPLDTQTCTLFFGTMSPFVSLKLADYEIIDRQVSSFLAFDNQWDLKGISSDVYAMVGRNSITGITLTLTRKPLFYIVCLMLPMLLTSYLNTFVFLLPLQSGEKISFLVSVFVSTSVFISFFQSVMPRGLDELPATMKLLIGVMTQSVIIICLTIFVTRRFHKEEEEKNNMTEENIKNGHSDASEINQSNTYADIQTGEVSAEFSEGEPRTASCPVLDKFKMDCCSRVAPSSTSPNPETQPSFQKNNDSKKIKPAKWFPWRFLFTKWKDTKITAQLLDHCFFVLAFISNTIFILVYGWNVYK